MDKLNHTDTKILSYDAELVFPGLTNELMNQN